MAQEQSSNPSVANPDAENMFAEGDNEGSTKNNSDDFFVTLDREVNQAVYDDSPQATPDSIPNQDPVNNGDNQVLQSSNDEVQQELERTKKRYSDSSREAQVLKSQLNQLKPFVPVLNAMKNDSGLVEHVRDYLVNDGKPSKTVVDKLGLDEDFQFDAHEAMTEGDSDSAKVLNAHVDGLVNHKINTVLAREKEQAKVLNETRKKQAEAEAFKAKKGWNDEQFNEFVTKAKSHVLTLDDAELILNKGNIQNNVANATKNDMLNQMKNVRQIPTSQGGVNNAASPQKSPDDAVFDAILGMDNDIDNLFGG